MTHTQLKCLWCGAKTWEEEHKKGCRFYPKKRTADQQARHDQANKFIPLEVKDGTHPETA